MVKRDSGSFVLSGLQVSVHILIISLNLFILLCFLSGLTWEADMVLMSCEDEAFKECITLILCKDLLL